MCAISFERFYVSTDPRFLKKISTPACWSIIIVGMLYGFFWSAMPFFGWSSYSTDNNNSYTGCHIGYENRSFNTMSYNLFMFLFVFFLPVIFMFICTLKLILIVRCDGFNFDFVISSFY